MQTRPIFIAAALALAITAAKPAAAADRFLHVQVQEDKKSGTDVNVNLPLQVAEQVLPTIDRGPLHQGRITIPPNTLQGIDLRSILDSVRNAPDGNFVTVKDGSQNISVEKLHGSLVIHVADSKPRGDNVDVTVPLSVVNALVTNVKSDELDIAGALQALDKAGDTFAVTVQSAGDHVRVWIDNNNQPQ